MKDRVDGQCKVFLFRKSTVRKGVYGCCDRIRVLVTVLSKHHSCLTWFHSPSRSTGGEVKTRNIRRSALAQVSLTVPCDRRPSERVIRLT